MIDLLRPVLSRIIGSVVGALAAWLATRWGIQLDEGARGQLTDGLLTLGLVVFGTVSSVVHRAVSAHTNPLDAASPTAAKELKK